MKNYNVCHSSMFLNRNTAKSAGCRKNRKMNITRTFVLALLIILFSGILIGGNIVSANAKDTVIPSEQTELCYRTILIQEGDTLWDIADDYVEAGMSSKEAYIKQIREINHIYDDNIYAGSYLVLPYYQ